jgi:hypothetical protein
MSDKKKLEDEAPETVTETTEDDSADVEGHINFKGGIARDAEAAFRGGERNM